MNFPHLESAERTDTGRRRHNNEDAVLRLPEHGLFCVADGMGGAAAGELASHAVVNALRRGFQEVTPAAPPAYPGLDSRIGLASRLLDEASRWIRERAEEMGVSGTGTTVVSLLFDAWQPGRGVCLHAGDSRAYLYREGRVKQLTRDHSVAAAAGISDEKSLPAFFRGVVTRAVGLDPHVDLEVTPFDVHPNDLYLLCSDGLTKMLSDADIAKMIKKQLAVAGLEGMTMRLVDAANEAGGEDNVSVILVQVGPALPAPHEGAPESAGAAGPGNVPAAAAGAVPAAGPGEALTPPTAHPPAATDHGVLRGATPVSAHGGGGEAATPVTADYQLAGEQKENHGWLRLLGAIFGRKPSRR